jgi:hypothetical protein
MGDIMAKIEQVRHKQFRTNRGRKQWSIEKKSVEDELMGGKWQLKRARKGENGEETIKRYRSMDMNEPIGGRR